MFRPEEWRRALQEGVIERLNRPNQVDRMNRFRPMSVWFGTD